MSDKLCRAEYESPLGTLVGTAGEEGVVSLQFVGEASGGALSSRLSPSAIGGSIAERHLEQLGEELAAYFAGELREFTVAIAPQVGTAFQRAAWAYLRFIPYGQTRSYGQQARGIGSPAAVRAVGQANGCNQMVIVVPCHRVIGANGKLTGFACGVERKRWLLEHEYSCAARGFTGDFPLYLNRGQARGLNEGVLQLALS